MALAMGNSEGTAASSVIFYFLAYGLMNIGAFAVVSMLEKTEQSMVQVDDLNGMAKRNPVLSASLAICLLSLAGIPPTIGFFGKFFVFSAAISEGFVWLAVWGVINSVISVYYYLRPVVNMYMKESDEEAPVTGQWLAKIDARSCHHAVARIPLPRQLLVLRHP
mgnify:CR=1 FL=1